MVRIYRESKSKAIGYRAHRLVESEGLVSSIRGRGTVVRSARDAPAIAERSVRERVSRAVLG